MSNFYKYRVTTKNVRNHICTYPIEATSASEARNKIKAKYPDLKIIACVKDENYSRSSSKNNNDDSSSLGSILLGAAVTAGVGLAAKWFSDKSKDKA